VAFLVEPIRVLVGENFLIFQTIGWKYQ